MSVAAAPGLVRRGHLRLDAALAGAATVVGPFEAQGPLGPLFDRVAPDELVGEKSYERAERKLMRWALELLLDRQGVRAEDIDIMFAGDLLDQITTTNFAARDLGVPLLGVYSACATTSESLLLSALAVTSGQARLALAATASHHRAAERQYRYPLELAIQRAPTAQWTATGGAAFLVRPAGTGPVRIVAATVGAVHDYGLKDPNNMGAAMAPAAADTILRHLRARSQTSRDYDLILTGDLARAGSPLLRELLLDEREQPGERLQDAGILLYDPSQDVHAGGSGAVCSALVLGALVLPQLRRREMRRVLLVATGSLHSPRSYQQGESIPTVAHALELEAMA
jgi:stage V sporulation protein AD